MLFNLDKLISFLILASLSVFVIFPKGGFIILLILILALIGLFFYKNKIREFEKWEMLLLTSFASFFLLISLNNLLFDGNIREIDASSRLIIVVPIYLYLRVSNIHYKYLEYGILSASFFLGLTYTLSRLYDFGSLPLFGQNPGIISLYASILGIASIFLISTKKSLAYKILCIVSFILGISASLFSGGRGVWIAALMTFIVLLWINPQKWSKPSLISGFFLMAVILISGFLYTGTGAKTKIYDGIQEFRLYIDERKEETSVGARLELWKSSYNIITDNLFFGVGEGNFKQENSKLISKGLIKPKVKKFNHPHNEYISTLVEQGLIGLFLLLFLFVTPIITCYKLIKSNNCKTELNFLMAFVMIIVLHYIFYSLTSGVFDHQSTSLFFSSYVLMAMALFSSSNKSSKNIS